MLRTVTPRLNYVFINNHACVASNYIIKRLLGCVILAWLSLVILIYVKFPVSEPQNVYPLNM